MSLAEIGYVEEKFSAGSIDDNELTILHEKVHRRKKLSYADRSEIFGGPPLGTDDSFMN